MDRPGTPGLSRALPLSTNLSKALQERVGHNSYQYALVAGPNKSYLWLLSRTPTMDAARQRELIAEAKALGFDTTKLVIVEQDR